MWPEGLIASGASDVENHPVNRVHPVCSSSFLDRIYRIDRIEEEMSHARLTLHAASALKPSLFELWRTRKAAKEEWGKAPTMNRQEVITNSQ
ncbi:MAG: hypothetical protein BWY82_00651 [Verrucomicrobia bacterium ADurb.Bin474]|nr:MAG: hypothetical protein BWY82_00651 [Verrucomicrobia bacterium ADurb.Bin474]